MKKILVLVWLIFLLDIYQISYAISLIDELGIQAIQYSLGFVRTCALEQYKMQILLVLELNNLLVNFNYKNKQINYLTIKHQ